jgi:hypothetical protein
MPKEKPDKKAKKIAVRIRVVPVEDVCAEIRSALKKLDAAIVRYQRKQISKAVVDTAYDEFAEAMRILGLGPPSNRL